MKKKAVALLIIAVMCLSMFTVLLPKAKADDNNQSSDSNGNPKAWPMFRGDLARTGYSASNAPSTNKTLWTNQIGGGILSSPCVVNDTVYISSEDGSLYALNASDGGQVWASQISGSYSFSQSSPAIADGVLYVASSSETVNALDTAICALNSTTGSPIWTYSIAGQIVDSSPAVVGGIVYIGTYSFSIVQNGSSFTITNFDGYLLALDAADGQLLWQNHIGAVMDSPAVVNGVVYASSISNDFSAGTFYALNASNGAQLWSVQTDDYSVSSPAVVNGVVYIASYNGTVYALDATQGNIIWSYQTDEYIDSSPAVALGAVYVGGASDSGNSTFYALDASTGSELWTSPIATDYSSPSVAGGVVLVESDYGNVNALNASTGKKIWAYQMFWPSYSEPVIVNGVVYLADATGNIYALSDSGKYVTSISVVCVPNPANSSSTVACTATVCGGFNYTGTVTWSSSSTTGTFSSTETPVVDGNSTVTYTDPAVGGITIEASYGGDQQNFPSQSSTTLALTPSGNFAFQISPSNNTVELYNLASYVATVIDSNGRSWDVTNQTTWSADPNTGSWYNGDFYASNSGTYNITGTYLGVNSTATLTVTPYTPPPPIGYLATSVAISAPDAAFDNSPVAISALVSSYEPGDVPTGNIAWSSNSTTGLFSSAQTELSNGNSTVTFTDTSPGTVAITATYSGDSINEGSTSTIDISCYPSENATLVISPTNITVASANPVALSASLTYPDGEAFDVTDQTTWTITPTDNSAFWHDGLYITSTPGTYTVTGAFLGLTSSTSLTVTGPLRTHGDAVSLSINPPNQYTNEVASGTIEPFTAEAYDAAGRSWDISSEVNWSISAGAGGSWSGNVYTAANPGNWVVTATLNGLQSSTRLTVINPKDATTVSVVQSSTQNTNMTVGWGSEFSVDLDIRNGFGVWGWSMDLRWNPQVLQLENVTEGSYLKQAGSTIFVPAPYSSGGAQVSDILLEIDSVNGSGVLATLTFKAVGSGNSEIVINTTNTANTALTSDVNLGTVESPNFVTLPFVAVNALVSVLPPSPVDFYHTGTVNFNDVIYFVAAYIQYYQTGYLNPACDLNHDGTLNFQDITLFVADYIAAGQSQAADGS